MYAEICYQRFAEGMDRDLYFSRILGHNPTDLNTANSYKIWQILD
ncbi:MAG: telomere resolvase [Nostoc indistinguendum CM1-VF10]|nr:telomere resolvase [Nostoc indistinguendum CM1-VF10]